MNPRQLSSIAVLLTATSIACVAQPTSSPPASSDNGVYTYRKPTRDGIGKVYMGREIAHVMGYAGMSWLERPDRETTEKPDRVVEALSLAPDDVVADIGAGSGYFAFRLAAKVPDGRVLAVDLQPEMLAVVEQRAQELGGINVEPIQGTVSDPNLPANTVDLTLMVDAYHEFSHPREMMEGIVRALKPGGRVVLVEYRGEDPTVSIKELHKMTQKQVRREMAAVGLAWRETLDFLPQQHVLVFEKGAEPSADGG